MAAAARGALAWSLLAQLSGWARVPGGHAGVAKRIHWFIDDASGMADPDNRRFVLANADIVDGIRPCCGFGTVIGSSNGTVRLDIRDEEPARKQARAATDRFYEGMRGRGKSIIPTISGGSFPREAVSRRDDLARQVLALVERRNLSGITLDYEGEHTGGANQSQFTSTWRSVADLLHQNGGKTLGICVGEQKNLSKANETMPIDFGHAWQTYIPFVDTMTQMSTYCDHCSRCLLHHEGCPFHFTEASVPALEVIVQNMLTAGVHASKQLSPGIWLGHCVNATTMTTGWTRPFLREFLTYLDKVGVRSLDLWTDGGGSSPDVGPNSSMTCPMPCPSTPTCGWALEELRAWRRR
eukprot:COSAG02_NODE_39_length_48074_cov_106.508890_14_plen_353_part_00